MYACLFEAVCDVTTVPSHLKSVKDLNSVYRAQLNFRSRPICVHRCIESLSNSNKGASNFGKQETILSLNFVRGFHRRFLSTSSLV